MERVDSSDDEFRRVHHDLMAPVLNIRAFSSEVDSALESLEEIVQRRIADLPRDFRAQVSDLLAEDIRPCLKFLGTAVEQLEQRIDSFAAVAGAGLRSNADA